MSDFGGFQIADAQSTLPTEETSLEEARNVTWGSVPIRTNRWYQNRFQHGKNGSHSDGTKNSDQQAIDFGEPADKGLLSTETDASGIIISVYDPTARTDRMSKSMVLTLGDQQLSTSIYKDHPEGLLRHVVTENIANADLEVSSFYNPLANQRGLRSINTNWKGTGVSSSSLSEFEAFVNPDGLVLDSSTRFLGELRGKKTFKNNKEYLALETYLSSHDRSISRKRYQDGTTVTRWYGDHGGTIFWDQDRLREDLK